MRILLDEYKVEKFHLEFFIERIDKMINSIEYTRIYIISISCKEYQRLIHFYNLEIAQMFFVKYIFKNDDSL